MLYWLHGMKPCTFATGIELHAVVVTRESPCGNLSFLRVIHLVGNRFSHEIPPEIRLLCWLHDLQLANNSLSGEIPSNLSACSELHTIDLGYNSLVGRIPDELGTLSKLLKIAVDNNNLTGNVLYSFSNLSSLGFQQLLIIWMEAFQISLAKRPVFAILLWMEIACQVWSLPPSSTSLLLASFLCL